MSPCFWPGEFFPLEFAAFSNRIFVCSKGGLPKVLLPLCIPAKLNGEGRLTPSTGFPWIPRNHLEPAVLDSDHYSVGSVERLDEFLTKHKEHHEQWSAYWEYTLRLFKYVTNQGLHEFHLSEYGRAEQGIVTIETSVVARHILMLYDELMKKKEQDYPPCYKDMQAWKTRHCFLCCQRRNR